MPEWMGFDNQKLLLLYAGQVASLTLGSPQTLPLDEINRIASEIVRRMGGTTCTV